MWDSTSFMNPVVRHLNRTLDMGGRLEVGAGGSVLRLLLGRVQEVRPPCRYKPSSTVFTVASTPTWRRPGKSGGGSHRFPGVRVEAGSCASVRHPSAASSSMIVGH